MSEADQTRLRQAVLDAIRTSVAPAYAKFTAFVRDEYAPKGRLEPGIWSLPNGDARYAAAAKVSTTTTMTPEEIHQLGLKQVAELESADAGDCEETRLQRSQEPERRHREGCRGCTRTRGEQILDEYRELHRGDVEAAAEAVRPPAEGAARGDADRGFQREDGGHALQPGHTRRVASGPRHGRDRRLREAAA